MYDKSWNKVKNELSKYTKYQGWAERGKVKQQFKKDELLSYLKNARGADHHTIQEITHKKGISEKPSKAILENIELYRLEATLKGPREDLYLLKIEVGCIKLRKSI